MAIVHDLAEAITGDVATRVALMDDPAVREEKRRRETDAISRLLGKIPDSEIRELWDEYEHAATDTALFVRDMNMIDMCTQAYCYERDRRYDESESSHHFEGWDRMSEFFATTEPRLGTATGRRLFDEIRDLYDQL
jgi:putative hydrolase of HD superfamily